MEINGDFTQRALVASAAREPWGSSPMAGVERVMLDRVGDEIARATSLVRYAPGSAFPRHVHGGGEEFIVLEGVFQDEHGDYPAGTYVRNPPTSGHVPRSDPGCIIFVKLWQFDPEDRQQLAVELGRGTNELRLFADPLEVVERRRLVAGQALALEADGGSELLILEGSGTLGDGMSLDKWGWLRLPPGERAVLTAGDGGAEVWLKHGNVQHAGEQIARVRAAAAVGKPVA